MNRDQVKGVAKDVVGKVQEQTGKLVGSKEQQIKGLSKQISWKATSSSPFRISRKDSLEARRHSSKLRLMRTGYVNHAPSPTGRRALRRDSCSCLCA